MKALKLPSFPPRKTRSTVQVGDEWQPLINISCQDRINMLKREFYSGCPSENKENYFEQTANSL